MRANDVEAIKVERETTFARDVITSWHSHAYGRYTSIRIDQAYEEGRNDSMC